MPVNRVSVPEVKLPKISGLELIETKVGFGLAPVFAPDTRVYRFVSVGRILSPDAPPPFNECFRGKECWFIAHWFSFAEDDVKRLDVVSLLDPECTEAEARAEFEDQARSFGDPEDVTALLKCIEPDVRVQSYRDAKLKERDLIEARLEVLKRTTPKTVALFFEALQAPDSARREALMEEAVAAYLAENAARWTEEEVKAWQERNPFGCLWMEEFVACLRKPARALDRVNFELALNWIRRAYDQMTAEQLAEAVFDATGERLSSAAIKKRRERLGLTTDRPPGPPPTESGQ